MQPWECIDIAPPDPYFRGVAMNTDLATAVREQLTKYGAMRFCDLLGRLYGAGVAVPSEQAVRDVVVRLEASGEASWRHKRGPAYSSTALLVSGSCIWVWIGVLVVLGGLNGSARDKHSSEPSPAVSQNDDAAPTPQPLSASEMFRGTSFFMTEHYPPDEHAVDRYRRDVLGK
jgi:hypothetical protein